MNGGVGRQVRGNIEFEQGAIGVQTGVATGDKGRLGAQVVSGNVLKKSGVGDGGDCDALDF